MASHLSRVNTIINISEPVELEISTAERTARFSWNFSFFQGFILPSKFARFFLQTRRRSRWDGFNQQALNKLAQASERCYRCFMSPVKEQIIAKLDQLPDPCLNEVLAMLDFLGWQDDGETESLLAVAGVLSGDPLTARQIENDLYGGGAGP